MHHCLLGKGKRPGKDEINLPDKRELEKKHTDTHTHTHTHTHTGFVFKARRETMKHTCRKCKHVSVSRASKAQEVCKLLQSNRLLSLSPSPSLPLSLSLSPSLPLSLSLSPSLCLSINLSLSYLN